MKLIPQHTKLLMIALSKLSVLPIFLIGCAGLPPFPTQTLIEYNAKSKVCGQYRITDPEHMKFEYVKDVPCPSIFGFTSKDIPKVLDWADDAQEFARNHCH